MHNIPFSLGRIRHFIFCCATAQTWLSTISLLRFLDHTKLDTHTHTHTHASAVGLLFTSDQPVAEAATYQTHNKHKRQHPCPQWDFFFIWTHCSTWPLTSNELRGLPHLVLVLHNIYVVVRAPCNWRIRRRHASRTPHNQNDTFLGGYGLTVVEIRSSPIGTTSIWHSNPDFPITHFAS